SAGAGRQPGAWARAMAGGAGSLRGGIEGDGRGSDRAAMGPRARAGMDGHALPAHDASPEGQSAPTAGRPVEHAARLLVGSRSGAPRAERMTLRRYTIIAAWLIIPVIVFATQVHVAYRMRGVPSRFPGWLSIQLIHWEIWAIAGPFVWQLGRRWPLSAPQLRS